MKKINEKQCIRLLKEKFPKFLSYWQSYIDHWGNEQGICIQMLPFSDFAIDVIKSKNDSEIKKIFDFVEFLLCQGNEAVQNAIATSFLEYLLSKDPEEIKFKEFSKYLGKNTIDYCKAWDKFTGVKTEGL